MEESNLVEKFKEFLNQIQSSMDAIAAARQILSKKELHDSENLLVTALEQCMNILEDMNNSSDPSNSINIKREINNEVQKYGCNSQNLLIYVRKMWDALEQVLISQINELFCEVIKSQNSDFMNLVVDNIVELNFSIKKPHNTFLHLAVMKQHVNTVRKLLSRGANIMEENYLRQNSLDIAVKLRNNEILGLLVEHISKENITESVYFKLLNDLLENDYGELAEKLLSKDVDILANYLTYSPNFFWIAVEKGFCKVVKKMIDRGVDVNFTIKDDWGSSKTALHISCQKGHHEMVKLLLDNGASGSFEKYSKFEYKFCSLSPLQTAIAFGKSRVVETFLDYGVDVDSASRLFNKKSSMLHVAAHHNKVGIIEVLLKRGIDINIKNEEGCQAIVNSRNSGKSSAFNYIINHKDFLLEFETLNGIIGNSIECQLNKVRRVLNYAKKFCSQQLNNEIDEKIINNPSYDSLLTKIARESYMVNSIDVIREYGADVNIRNKSGRTAIFIVFLMKDKLKINKFLKYGADINIKCNRGLTPLDYALMKKIPDEIYKEVDIKDYDKYEEDVGFFDDFIEHISQHLFKMKLLNLYVDEDNFQSVLSRATDPYRHQEKYQKEITKMKETIINRDVSYYDIVKADLNTMVAYLQDDVILQALESKSYKSRFPRFKIIISGCLYRGLVRKNLLDQVSRFTVFDMIFKFPYPCMRRIIDNFSNSDLRRVIYSYGHLM